MGLSDEVDTSLVFTPSPTHLPPRCALPLERGGENQPPQAAHDYLEDLLAGSRTPGCVLAPFGGNAAKAATDTHGGGVSRRQDKFRI
jgi:hypothetical protein